MHGQQVVRAAERAALVLLVFGLIACGGGGGGDGGIQPQGDAPPVAYNLGGNPNLLVADKTFDLAGVDSNNAAWSGVWRIQRLADTTLDGTPVTPVQHVTTLTHVPTGAFESGSSIAYVGADGRTLREVDDDGEICFLDQPGDYPATATIGEFGVTDSGACSDGTTTSGTWALEDASDGRANLVLASTTRTADGSTVRSREWTLRIDPAGNVERGTMRVLLHQQELLLTLQATPR